MLEVVDVDVVIVLDSPLLPRLLDGGKLLPSDIEKPLDVSQAAINKQKVARTTMRDAFIVCSLATIV